MTNTKLNYELVKGLYELNYNTTEIANMVGSVNGHISKVLRKMGVEMRKRGVKSQVKPLEVVFSTRVERGELYNRIIENGGLNQREVADFFHQDKTTVSKAITAYKKAVNA